MTPVNRDELSKGRTHCQTSVWWIYLAPLTSLFFPLFKHNTIFHTSRHILAFFQRFGPRTAMWVVWSHSTTQHKDLSRRCECVGFIASSLLGFRAVLFSFCEGKSGKIYTKVMLKGELSDDIHVYNQWLLLKSVYNQTASSSFAYQLPAAFICSFEHVLIRNTARRWWKQSLCQLFLMGVFWL